MSDTFAFRVGWALGLLLGLSIAFAIWATK